MISLVIQAGGKSSRMGQDKALMPFLGKPLIERVIDRVSPIADKVIITTNNPSEYEYLGLPLYEDLIPDRGALGGLYTALHSASHPLVAIIGCDMPFASPSLLKHGCQVLEDTGADVAIPLSEAGLEPMHAVYRKNTCLPAVKGAIDAGKWKLIAFHDDVDVRIISTFEIYQHDPKGLAFLNINTLEELAQAEVLAREVDI